MNLSRFGSVLICTIRPSATACQQPNSNSGRAAGVPLIIYLPLDGGNWSSVATTKRWLIKGCLFRNQNLLLDRLLHLVPIISSRSPSHMLNSARMWELHHIRMHVFCNVLYICVCVCSACSATSCCVWKTSVILHLSLHSWFCASLRVSILWPLAFIYIQMSARALAWVDYFPIGLRRWPEREAGFRGIIMVYIAASTAASHYRQRRSWPSEGEHLVSF